MTDPTEPIRRLLVEEINSEAAERAALEAAHGRVWSTDELREDFDALGFLAPFIRVRRKADGVVGILTFQHSPRYYFDFVPATH